MPRGVTVSTLDSESSDRGSNPREAFSRVATLLVPALGYVCGAPAAPARIQIDASEQLNRWAGNLFGSARKGSNRRGVGPAVPRVAFA